MTSPSPLRQRHQAPARGVDPPQEVLRRAQAQPEDLLAFDGFQVVEEGKVRVGVIGQVGLGFAIEPEHADQVGKAVNQVVDQRRKAERSHGVKIAA